jgi:GAF domain/Pyridoxamine 5'-phosphate oxidase
MTGSARFAVPLESIASCFEGIIPSPICSCSKDGVPNLTYLSIVHRLDAAHVGLSCQFFNKTRRNIAENPRAQVIVVSPETADQYRLDLAYERTETEGAAFDRMKARLEAIASQSGMSHVFALRGLDIYRVLDCRGLNLERAPEPSPTGDRLRQLDALTERLAGCGTLDQLMGEALEELARSFGYVHAFVMVPDEEGRRLYTIASRGYAISGVGSEVAVGEGILGIAAARKIAVRNANLTRDRLFFRAVRAGVERRGDEAALEQEIVLPGLVETRSQLVVPLMAQRELLGVLCLQSEESGRFRGGDEDAMQIAARQLAMAMSLLRLQPSDAPAPLAEPRKVAPPAARAVVRHYCFDDSIFVDDAYLIKGVPGRIFWKLVQLHAASGRTTFTNREIRLDASLRLPDIKDNLETRLILLRRRLAERCPFLRLVPSGRGQFRFEADRRLVLEEQD